MKKTFKKLSVFALVFACVFALVGCKKPKPDQGGDDEVKEYLSLDNYKAYVKADLATVLASVGDSVASSIRAAVEEEYNKGINAINAAGNTAAAKAAFDNAKAAIANEIPLANGIYSFTSLSNAEKTEILGALEAYAVRNGITGISLFEDGGYVMYQPSVTLGTENYISGYGFGVLAEGSITEDLATEANAAWKRYYHTFNAADPGTANYLNDQGSEVADFYGYFGAGYFTTFMNENKDGYDWVPELAKEKPIAVNPDENGQATIWRFPVRTANDGLKYNTNSAIASRAAFNNRGVELEDYLTPFKLLLDANNGLFRGSELANTAGVGFKGAKAYYEYTKTQTPAEGDFEEQVGIRAYEEDGVAYLEFEFTQALDSFYAMYYSTSSLYMPIPQDFLDLVGTANYLGYNSDKTETPVDNSLSLGAYTLERWDSGQQVVYKKNPNYVYADSKYAIAGIHMNILTAAAEDPEAGFNEFLAGKIHATGIPQTKLDEYKSDPRTRQTLGSSNFKLNVNATDAETWEYLFGVNGVVAQTDEEDYWVVEPALSNPKFVKALSLSINRFEFAAARGSIPSVDYLSSNYMSDPVNGISYAATQAHKDAVAGLLAGTDGYGYNLELARDYFKAALIELEDAGKYTPNADGSPVVIELEIAWMYPQHETNYHDEIAQYLQDAFNHESVSGGKYQLDVKFWVGNVWSDVYYSKLMLGQYDLGFGSISGNTLNPLDFVSVLSSDQSISGSFTLNWGTDTNDPEADILVYNGMRWSYDALWTAGNGVAVVQNGANVPAYEGELLSHKANDDGTYTSEVKVNLAFPELTELDVFKVCVCWYTHYYETEEYLEENIMESSVVTVDEDGNYVITITTPKEIADLYKGEIGYDVYFDITIDGHVVSGQYVSVYAEIE